MANEPPSLEEVRLRERLKALQQCIGYDFGDDASLLRRAVEHSSAAKEESSRFSNESLEFLGDAVLYLTITRMLFNPMEQEGVLTEKRKCLIKNRTLLQVGKAIGLKDFLSVGKSIKVGAGVTDGMISDTVEAIIGAIYLKDKQRLSQGKWTATWNVEDFDSGVERFISRWFFETGIAGRALSEVDYISVLKEWCDKHKVKWPEPDPERTVEGFECDLRLEGHQAVGKGKSKQAAREDWARQMLASLKVDSIQEAANGQ
jgi:dsRNA-specific ribonuclease